MKYIRTDDKQVKSDKQDKEHIRKTQQGRIKKDKEQTITNEQIERWR